MSSLVFITHFSVHGPSIIAEQTIHTKEAMDELITLHPFVIYEGTDVRDNLEVVLSSFTQQIKDIEGSEIRVDNKFLKIEQFGMFDLCASNCIIGKQNHSSTFPDAWTNVRLNHLQNHKNKIHTPSECKDIDFLSLKEIYKNLTNHSVETGENSCILIFTNSTE